MSRVVEAAWSATERDVLEGVLVAVWLLNQLNPIMTPVGRSSTRFVSMEVLSTYIFDSRGNPPHTYLSTSCALLRRSWNSFSRISCIISVSFLSVNRSVRGKTWYLLGRYGCLEFDPGLHFWGFPPPSSYWVVRSSTCQAR